MSSAAYVVGLTRTGSSSSSWAIWVPHLGFWCRIPTRLSAPWQLQKLAADMAEAHGTSWLAESTWHVWANSVTEVRVAQLPEETFAFFTSPGKMSVMFLAASAQVAVHGEDDERHESTLQ